MKTHRLLGAQAARLGRHDGSRLLGHLVLDGHLGNVGAVGAQALLDYTIKRPYLFNE